MRREDVDALRMDPLYSPPAVWVCGWCGHDRYTGPHACPGPRVVQQPKLYGDGGRKT